MKKLEVRNENIDKTVISIALFQTAKSEKSLSKSLPHHWSMYYLYSCILHAVILRIAYEPIYSSQTKKKKNTTKLIDGKLNKLFH